MKYHNRAEYDNNGFLFVFYYESKSFFVSGSRESYPPEVKEALNKLPAHIERVLEPVPGIKTTLCKTYLENKGVNIPSFVELF